MSELRKAAEQALEFLTGLDRTDRDYLSDYQCNELDRTIKNLRAALAEPETTIAKDAYDGAMEEMRIWKKRALEAEEINRKFVAEVNGPSFMGEPVMEEPEQSEPVGWEWRWFDASPHTVTSGQWTEWERVEPRNRLQTVEDAVNEFRAFAANGNRYEVRALYTTPPAQKPPPRLTAEQRSQIMEQVNFTYCPTKFADAIETAVRKQAGWE